MELVALKLFDVALTVVGTVIAEAVCRRWRSPRAA